MSSHSSSLLIFQRLPNLDLANLTETFQLAKFKLETSYTSVGGLAGVDIRSEIDQNYFCCVLTIRFQKQQAEELG